MTAASIRMWKQEEDWWIVILSMLSKTKSLDKQVTTTTMWRVSANKMSIFHIGRPPVIPNTAPDSLIRVTGETATMYLGFVPTRANITHDISDEWARAYINGPTIVLFHKATRFHAIAWNPLDPVLNEIERAIGAASLIYGTRI